MNFRPRQPRVDGAEYRTYLSAGVCPIPLYMWNAKSADGKKFGKRPRDLNWTRRAYDPAKVIEACIANGWNMGIRLTAEWLVVDVDPRNGGRKGFKKLCRALRLNPSKWPRVVTGSGGDHYYLRLPPGVRVVDKLKDFEGVEFKSLGRQVVAAGSIHPETFGLYAWDWLEGRFELKDAPEAPTRLVEAIRRPERAASVGKGGQYTQEQIARALGALDVTKFRNHDDWLRLMMAAHHASAGNAREEFIEWSTSDPNYADAAEIIGRRWDSLHAEKMDGITYRTLNHILREYGASDAMAAGDAAADFEDEVPESDDDWMNAGESEELAEDDDVPNERAGRFDDAGMSALEKLNDTYCAVFASGRYRIMFRERHAGGMRWGTSSKIDFISLLENRKIERDMEGLPKGAAKTISLGKAWQEWLDRKTAFGTIFDPTAEPGALVGIDEGDRSLNLWSGFGIKPKRGKWPKFRAMILNDICSDDEIVFDYVLRWLAWKVQNPGLLPGVAVIMQGPKGVGKTTLGETMVAIYGEHGMPVSDIDQIAGRFNGHLETITFIYADEAFWGGDRKNEAKAKKLITDREASYEYKGVDIFKGVNHAALLAGGNEKWMVPATIDERRFCVTKVSDTHRGKFEYWNAIHHELNNGGRAAFLFDMLNMKLNGWHPRVDVPQTEALAEQKLHGLSGVAKWWHDRLRDGLLFETMPDTTQVWAERDLHVQPSAIIKAYDEWLARLNPRAVVTYNSLLKELRVFGWDGGKHCRAPSKNRERYWLVPRLDKARAIFAEVYGLGNDPFTDDA